MFLVAFGVAAFLAQYIASSKYGWNSFLSFGIIGTLIYASPIFIGYYRPFYYESSGADILQRISDESIVLYIITFSIYALILAILPKPSPKKILRTDEDFLIACSVIVIIGYALIAAQQGLFYFLKDRQDVDSNLLTTLWRWFVVFGVIAAIEQRRRKWLVFYAVFLLTIFIAGDRTLVAITAIAIIFAFYLSETKIKLVPDVKSGLILTSIFLLLIIGKPIYIGLKAFSVDEALELVSGDSFRLLLLTFEPLTTFSFIEFVLERDYRINLYDILLSIGANLLIFPSVFGVEGNYFNIHMTEVMVGDLTWGIAGSYLASGYVMAGYIGVALFSFIFIFTLWILQHFSCRSNPVARILMIAVAAFIAIYIHRNGIDNALSFIRQILICMMFLWFVMLNLNFVKKNLKKA